MDHQANNLTCSPTTVINFSLTCLEPDAPEECFPVKEESLLLASATFHIGNIVIGVVGNLLTLLSIHYGKKHQRSVRGQVLGQLF